MSYNIVIGQNGSPKTKWDINSNSIIAKYFEFLLYFDVDLHQFFHRTRTINLFVSKVMSSSKQPTACWLASIWIVKQHRAAYVRLSFNSVSKCTVSTRPHLQRSSLSIVHKCAIVRPQRPCISSMGPNSVSWHSQTLVSASQSRRSYANDLQWLTRGICTCMELLVLTHQ